MERKHKRLLIVAATTLEIDPLIAHLQETYTRLSDQELSFAGESLTIRVGICGIGLMATAFNLGRLLSSNTFDCVLQLGIAGAYPSAKIPLGSAVYVTTERVGDLGVSAKNGDFLTLQQIGLEESSAGILPGNPPPDLAAFIQQLQHAEGISINHNTGDAGCRDRFAIKPETIVTESMEGAALHYVCAALEIPFVQIRSISNWVEPRDKSRWQMGAAIKNLNKTAIDLLQYL